MQIFFRKMTLLVVLAFGAFATGAPAAQPSAALLKAKKEAETKGYAFATSRDEILAGAKKEGSLRALLGFDTPTIRALHDGFRKKYPFINAHFEEHGNPAASQRFLLELKTGRISDWDIANVLSEAQHEFVPYLEKVDLRAMAEFGVLQIPPKIGRKMLADIRPNSIAGLVPAMGLEWVESFARKLAAQQPVWVRGHTVYLNAMAAGEYRLFFGTYYHGIMRMKKKGAQDLEALILEPVPVRPTETHAILKGARRPAAAMLFLEYAASPEGQKILWDVEPFKSSIFSPGSKTEELVRGKKTSVADWDHIAKQNVYMEKITAAYGFPREEKK